jgi:hypothetical protein
MKTKSIKLLTAALAAGALVLGSATARATVIGTDAIQGCLLANVAGGTGLQAMQKACGTTGTTGNQFELDATIGKGDEFAFKNAVWAVTVDFGVDGETELTITNVSNRDRSIIAGTHMLFGDLDFPGGQTFADEPFVGVKLEGGGAINSVADLLTLPVDTGTNGVGEWYHIAFNNAATFTAGQTVVLKATLNAVPEPGTLALLGVVLVAIGLANIKRVRLFGARALSLHRA